MKNLIPAIAGAILGIVSWKFTPYSADFGVGPLVWIIICAVGGMYTWGKLQFMGILAEKFQGFLATFGIPEDLSVFLIGVPLLILAVYLNYKK